MMCSYRYRFRMDMRAIDALANTKLGSGCNLLGYYMYRGGTNPTGKRTPYLNEGQIPKRSYDYQAAIGEFGRLRESYGRLRAIHMFCRLFSGFFEQTIAVLPKHLKALQPDDPEPLRFSVRVKGNSGFLFVNNFQDHITMQNRHGDEALLSLPDGDVVFRFDIAAGEKRHPAIRCRTGGCEAGLGHRPAPGPYGTHLVFPGPGVHAAGYAINGQRTEATVGEAFTAGSQTIMTLSRRDAQPFWVYNDTAYLCDRPLMRSGQQLTVEIDNGSADLFTWSEEACSFVLCHHVESHRSPVMLPWREVGTGRYTLDVPADALKGHKQVLLRVQYRGDIGHTFAGNEMIPDNFCNGDVWDIRLDCCAEALAKTPLVLYLTPVKKNVTVDASAMAGLQEKAELDAAALLSAELITIDDYPNPCIRSKSHEHAVQKCGTQVHQP